MGLDVEIHIDGIITNTEIQALNARLAQEGIADLADEWGNWFARQPSGRVEFMSMWRYWAPGYERGPWPRIAAVLALASATGREVRYGNDCNEPPLEPWTEKRSRDYWVHWAGPDGRAYYS
jgi:hypothetical protein